MIDNLNMVIRGVISRENDEKTFLIENNKILTGKLKIWLSVLAEEPQIVLEHVYFHMEDVGVPPTEAYLLSQIERSDVKDYLKVVMGRYQLLDSIEFDRLFKKVHSYYYRVYCKENLDILLSGDADDDKIREEAFKLLVEEQGQSDEGSFLNEGTLDIEREYDRQKLTPEYGLLTGIEKIDIVTRGHKKQELWLWAGFASHGKSSCMINDCYINILNGYNVIFVSLEMSKKQLLQRFVTRHSCNEKFRDISGPLKYNSIRDGELTGAEEDFYKSIVLKDLRENKDYGVLYIYKPRGATRVSTIYQEMRRIEALTGIDFDKLCVDYVQLMVGDSARGFDRAEDINGCIRALKILSMVYEGRGLAVSSGFQTNRESFKMHLEKGQYIGLSCLASHNESERSADCVITSWIDEELRAGGFIQHQILKNRDGDVEWNPFQTSWIKESVWISDLQEDVEISLDSLLDISNIE